MRVATCLGFAVAASLPVTAPALAQGSPAPRVFGVFAGPALTGPQTNVRLTRLVSVRAKASVLETTPYPAKIDSTMEHAGTLLFYGAVVDVYPLGNGLRFSAGWDGDLSYSEILLSDHGNVGGTAPAQAVLPSFTIGYGRSVKGPLKLGVDGGILLRDMPRGNDPVSPRLTGDAGVSHAYPVVRFSLSRAF